MEAEQMKEYIGIDIGGTKISVVKGDGSGRVTQKIRFENDRSPKLITVTDGLGRGTQ
jgi:predicted NBD/HSP70 family sugar kinase